MNPRVIAPAALALVVLAACAAPADSTTSTSSDSSTSTTAAGSPSSAGKSSAKPKPPAKPKPAAVTIPDEGTLTVPGDVKPGTYSARVPADSFGCYWARLRNTDGDLNGIIANGNVTPGGRVTVTVKRTDKAFQTNGCGTWTKAS